jgi:hypothetical protein
VAEQGRCAEVTVRRGGEDAGRAGGHHRGRRGGGHADAGPAGGRPGEAAAAEKAKLQKERGKLAADRDFFSKKLNNPQFVERAKPEVIEKDRAKLAELEAALARLDAAPGGVVIRSRRRPLHLLRWFPLALLTAAPAARAAVVAVPEGGRAVPISPRGGVRPLPAGWTLDAGRRWCGRRRRARRPPGASRCARPPRRTAVTRRASRSA